ncbi:MAG: hypothetical protein CL677_07690 [Bdellovibrionaceae bacterium]|nr:hypothetical protein [Pseudobdellovibrionaceae bacterium]|tara:strand:- start:388 stop:711 length:324 start_codon:yes stop_codon:yes gene_type:complete
MYINLLRVLAAAGIVLPFWKLVPWVIDNGLDIPLLVNELFSTQIGAFFGLDVIVSAIVLVLFIITDARRMGMEKYWVAIVCTFTVGVSFGLPIYLLMREKYGGSTNA